MLASLGRHGWNASDAPVFIQSFETNLREIRPKTKIKLIQLLEGHPWFETSVVAASDNSAGKPYGTAARWQLESAIPESVANLTVQACAPGLDCDFVLSGLPSNVARETELDLAKSGMPAMIASPRPPRRA